MNELLRYYFQKGFSYKNMLSFLSKFHDTEMSMRSLQQRLHDMRLNSLVKNWFLNITPVEMENFFKLEDRAFHGRISFILTALQHHFSVQVVFIRVFLRVSVDKIWNKAADVEDKGLFANRKRYSHLSNASWLLYYEELAEGFEPFRNGQTF